MMLIVVNGNILLMLLWPAGWNDGVESLKESHAVGLAFLPLNVPALVPGHVGRGLDHVVTVPPGDGHEGNSGGFEADL